jgi:MFS family permease
MPVGKAALQYAVIAVGATAGSYLAGWATDRFFGSRRGPMICILMAALGGLSLLYHSAVERSAIEAMLLLVAIGFCIIGPQVLLVGTAPADLAHGGTSAAAAGFVNFMGYIGAATGDVVTGYFSAPEHGGWQTAIYIWAGWAFAGAAIMAILWNTTTGKVGLLPGVVPKLAAVATLVVAAMMNSILGQPVALVAATLAGAACAIGSIFTRRAAVPGLVIAAAGLIYVFASYAQGTTAATWQLRTAWMAYSLAIVSTLMILVEPEAEPCASS